MSLKLKLLRLQANMTLEDLAQASDLTRSYVSKVERGASSPSIGAAMNLARALGVPVEELFGEPSDTDPVTITRLDKRALRLNAGAESRVVAGTSKGHRMLAFVLRPSAERTRDHPMSHHDGEEILYVLKGRLELQLSGRTEILDAGDCAHFNSAVPHKVTSIGKVPAEALLVVLGAVPQ
jgi:transcriptional regulator with XRE-family HTH domain